MIADDIFSSLAKHNSTIDENYLTEAFVFILNSLLKNNRSQCIKILKYLCINKNDYDFSPKEEIIISTQETTEQGRPDIKISSPNKVIYIEVKHDSGLGYKQLERYRYALRSSNVPIKKVILLTRFAIDFEEDQVKPYRHVRWFQIHNWFAGLRVKDPIDEYLIKSFLKFLEVKNMSIQKISWEYIDGVSAFKNFINMLEVAIKDASLKIHKKSPGWDHTGFYIENNRKFCGVYHDNNLLLKFEVYSDRKTLYSSGLNLELIHFFCLSKDEQLNQLTQFIKKCDKETRGLTRKNK
ncbi:MAG: PD-(D/E)XK nuclease family protein [Candidatus Omnitrophica bacterium]|nr:PD-(D/E)XK nuclease family protein [Candidatus Omnitrophota bacterium]